MKKKVICVMILLVVSFFTACNDGEPQVPAAGNSTVYEAAGNNDTANDTEDNTDELANHNPLVDDFDLLTDELLEEVIDLFVHIDNIIMAGDFTDSTIAELTDIFYQLDELLTDVLPQNYIDELWEHLDELQELFDYFAVIEEFGGLPSMDFASDRWTMHLAPGWTPIELFGVEVIASPTGSSNINVVAESMFGATFEEYVNFTIAALEEELFDFELIDRGYVNGVYFIEYTSIRAESTTQFLIEHNGDMFIITYTIWSQDTHRDDIFRMLDSFRIIG